MYSFGRNASGQLGIGNTIDQSLPVEVEFFSSLKIKEIITGFFHTFVITSDNTLYSYGSNVHGQLGHLDNLDRDSPQEVLFFKDKNIHQVATGESHTLVLTKDGRLYGFGQNTFYQLGFDDSSISNKYQIFEIPFFKNFRVKVEYNDEIIQYYYNFDIITLKNNQKWLDFFKETKIQFNFK